MYRFDPKVKALVNQEVQEVEAHTHEIDEQNGARNKDAGLEPASRPPTMGTDAPAKSPGSTPPRGGATPRPRTPEPGRRPRAPEPVSGRRRGGRRRERQQPLSSPAGGGHARSSRPRPAARPSPPAVPRAPHRPRRRPPMPTASGTLDEWKHGDRVDQRKAAPAQDREATANRLRRVDIAPTGSGEGGSQQWSGLRPPAGRSRTPKRRPSISSGWTSPTPSSRWWKNLEPASSGDCEVRPGSGPGSGRPRPGPRTTAEIGGAEGATNGEGRDARLRRTARSWSGRRGRRAPPRRHERVPPPKRQGGMPPKRLGRVPAAGAIRHRPASSSPPTGKRPARALPSPAAVTESADLGAGASSEAGGPDDSDRRDGRGGAQIGRPAEGKRGRSGDQDQKGADMEVPLDEQGQTRTGLPDQARRRVRLAGRRQGRTPRRGHRGRAAGGRRPRSIDRAQGRNPPRPSGPDPDGRASSNRRPQTAGSTSMSAGYRQKRTEALARFAQQVADDGPGQRGPNGTGAHDGCGPQGGS